MGCGNSKLGPDSTISNDKRIKPVLHLDSNKPPTKGGNKKGQQYVCKDNKHSETHENNIERSKAKLHKIKYDPRITAKYEIKALIGKGTYSRVLRVEHRISKQPYVLKLIDCKEGREAFETELSVLRRVKHPYIVQLIEVFDSSVRMYMVMELATGGDLFDRIVSRGSFTERDATRVLQMVLDGVNYLHSLGITHRDLKPDNLLYYHPGHDSKILITDFGLANIRKSSGDAFMQTACGTPEYIAPEIVSRKFYTSMVDMWAMGVIAYVLLSGTFPFDDENRSRLYKLILRAKYSYSDQHWMDISEAAKNFINQLLIVDPLQRMSATEALQHPWIVSNAASSLNKNLQRSISQNLFKSSTRSSSRSSNSKRSSRSGQSHRGSGHKVCIQDLQNLHEDTETSANHEK